MENVERSVNLNLTLGLDATIHLLTSHSLTNRMDKLSSIKRLTRDLKMEELMELVCTYAHTDVHNNIHTKTCMYSSRLLT